MCCILYLVYMWILATPHRWARPAHRVRWHHESIPLTVNSFYLQMWTKLCLNILFYCTSEVFTLFVAICLHSYMYWFYLFVFSPLCIFNVFSQGMDERIRNDNGCISLTFVDFECDWVGLLKLFSTLCFQMSIQSASVWGCIIRVVAF